MIGLQELDVAEQREDGIDHVTDGCEGILKNQAIDFVNKLWHGCSVHSHRSTQTAPKDIEILVVTFGVVDPIRDNGFCIDFQAWLSWLALTV